MIVRSKETLVSGLGHPEGPCVLPDGRVVFANTYASELGVWEDGVGKSTFAYTGGGPNASVLGSDGYLYVTQTPNVGPWVAPDARPPSIQRVSMDGVVEIVASEVDGRGFHGPNDLAFGADGRLYFTDSGDWDPESKPHPGRIIAIDYHGHAEVVEALDHVYPNGIACEPDGSVVWGESYTRQIWRRRPAGTKERLLTLADGHVPDGMKLDANGSIWIATFSSGGLDVIGPDGTHQAFVEAGGVPLNLAFDGRSLYVTEMGHYDSESSEVGFAGNLVRIEVDVAGAQPFKGSIVSPRKADAPEPSSQV